MRTVAVLAAIGVARVMAGADVRGVFDGVVAKLTWQGLDERSANKLGEDWVPFR